MNVVDMKVVYQRFQIGHSIMAVGTGTNDGALFTFSQDGESFFTLCADQSHTTDYEMTMREMGTYSLIEAIATGATVPRFQFTIEWCGRDRVERGDALGGCSIRSVRGGVWFMGGELHFGVRGYVNVPCRISTL